MCVRYNEEVVGHSRTDVIKPLGTFSYYVSHSRPVRFSRPTTQCSVPTPPTADEKLAFQLVISCRVYMSGFNCRILALSWEAVMQPGTWCFLRPVASRVVPSRRFVVFSVAGVSYTYRTCHQSGPVSAAVFLPVVASQWTHALLLKLCFEFSLAHLKSA